MKKILTFLLLFSIITGCSVFKPVYFSSKSEEPQPLVDSLIESNNLSISKNYQLWPKAYFIDSDSTKVMEYTSVQIDMDTLYVISVTEYSDYSEILYRKEVKK